MIYWEHMTDTARPLKTVENVACVMRAHGIRCADKPDALRITELCRAHGLVIAKAYVVAFLPDIERRGLDVEE